MIPEQIKELKAILETHAQVGRDPFCALKDFCNDLVDRSRQAGVREAKNIIIDARKEFANTPIEKRQSGWEWLDKVYDKLIALNTENNNEISNKTLGPNQPLPIRNNTENKWICGKCTQIQDGIVGEEIPEHSLHCPHRPEITQNHEK